MLTSGQVGEILCHTTPTIIRMAKRGEFPIVSHTPGGQARFNGRDIFDYILRTYRAHPIDLEWGAWFAGFVDGEGCFCIRKGDLCPMFSIGLTVGDIDVLIEIHEKLHVGHIYREEVRVNSEGYVSRPRGTFMTCSVKDCCLIVDLFRRFPLRSRKAQDFEIWARYLDYRAQGIRRRDIAQELWDLRLARK